MANGAEARAVEAEEQLRTSLEAIDEAFFRMGAIRDAAGSIVDFEFMFCNRAGLALLARRREDLIGQRLLELYPSNRTRGMFESYVRVTETGEPLRFEFTFNEGGAAGEIEVVVSRAGDGYVIAGHDITERKRLQRELAELTEQLQTALTTRVVIEQAKGYLARAAGTDPATAFKVIRRYAQNNNLKIHPVCEAILAGKVPELAGPARPG